MTGQEIIEQIQKRNLLDTECDLSQFVTPSDTQILQEETVLPQQTDKNKLYEKASSYDFLKEMYRSGKIKLNNDERELLEFCHNTDMRKFLKEEFAKNPTPRFNEVENY